jgi:hypothetical protein
VVLRRHEGHAHRRQGPRVSAPHSELASLVCQQCSRVLYYDAPSLSVRYVLNRNRACCMLRIARCMLHARAPHAARRVASRRRGIDNFSRNLETIGLRHHWLGG